MRKKLAYTLIENSTKETLEECLSEWEITDVEIGKKIGDFNCECSQRIKNKFLIKNSSTGKELIVGSTCVYYFKIGVSKELTDRMKATHDSIMALKEKNKKDR